MGKETPLVTVCLPFHNNERTLELAVKSIIKQTYSNWELMLVDDGSTDNSLEIAKMFNDVRIKVFSDKKNIGLASRLNQTTYQCKGKYFARMDGDDISYPQRLEKQVNFLEQHPEVDLLGTRMLIFKGDGVALGTRYAPAEHEDICRKPHWGFPMAHATFMGRLEWFKQHPYREERRTAQDQDLLFRNYENGRFANLQEALYGGREEKLILTKMLKSRRDDLFGRATYAWNNGRKAMAIRITAITLAKASVETVAIGTGLDYRILRHRALPASLQEIAAWERVYNFVNTDFRTCNKHTRF